MRAFFGKPGLVQTRRREMNALSGRHRIHQAGDEISPGRCRSALVEISPDEKRQMRGLERKKESIVEWVSVKIPAAGP